MTNKPRERCPCDGIILADTEDCTTPLCDKCAEEISKAFGVNKALLKQAERMAESLSRIQINTELYNFGKDEIRVLQINDMAMESLKQWQEFKETKEMK